jgi:hypothetical protein
LGAKKTFAGPPLRPFSALPQWISRYQTPRSITDKRGVVNKIKPTNEQNILTLRGFFGRFLPAKAILYLKKGEISFNI